MRAWEIQSAWNKIDESQQATRAQAALKTCSQILGIQDDAQVIEVKDNDRFVLSYIQDPAKPDFGKAMIKLESLMRQTMGVVVDLRLATKEDINRRAKRNGRV